MKQKKCKYEKCKNMIPKGMKSYCSPKCQSLAKKARDKKKNSVQLGTTKRLTSYKTLKKKTWSIFSKYIRLTYADNEGKCTCVTCGNKLPWKEMHAGHGIQGRGNFILFDERFVYPQDYRCNVGLGGNYGKYAVFLMKDKGMSLEEYEEALIDSKKPYKISIGEMAEIYKKYEALVDALLKTV